MTTERLAVILHAVAVTSAIQGHANTSGAPTSPSDDYPDRLWDRADEATRGQFRALAVRLGEDA